MAACRVGPAPAVPASAEATPDQVIETFVMDVQAEGAALWRLAAPEARVFDRDHRLELTLPDLRFFTEGRPSSSVRADRGQLDTATRDFWLAGDVVMLSTEGARLASDWARYDATSDRLSSTGPVTITRGDSVVHGVGWSAAPDLSLVEIRRQTGRVAEDDLKGLRRP